MIDGEVTGARACWLEKSNFFVQETGVTKVAVDPRTREVLYSDARGVLWYDEDLGRGSALGVLLLRSRIPEFYGGETPWGHLRLTRGWAVLWQEALPREVVCFQVPPLVQDDDDFFDAGAPVTAVIVGDAEISAISPDVDGYLATGDALGGLQVVGLFAANKRARVPRAHDGPILAVTVVKEKILISGSRGLAKVWFMTTTTEDNFQLAAQRELDISCCSPTAFAAISGKETSLLAVATHEGTLAIWTADDEPKLLQVHDDTLEPVQALKLTTNNILASLDHTNAVLIYDVLNDALFPRDDVHSNVCGLASLDDGQLWLCHTDASWVPLGRDPSLDDDVPPPPAEAPPPAVDDVEEEPPLALEATTEDCGTLGDSDVDDIIDPPPAPDDDDEEDDDDVMEVPRVSPPTPTEKDPEPYPEPPRCEERRIQSTAALARPPSQELTFLERRARIEDARAEAADEVAQQAKDDVIVAELALADAVKPLPPPSLVAIEPKIKPRRRLVPKQVDHSWLEMREKLRPQAQDFIIPDARPQARVRIPLAPVPIDALLSSSGSGSTSSPNDLSRLPGLVDMALF